MTPGSSKNKSDSPIQSLKTKRLNLIDSLNRCKRSLQKKQPRDAAQLSARQKLMDRYIQQILCVQDEIDAIHMIPEHREEVEELCVTVESLLLDLLPKQQVQSEVSISKNHIKLPAQKLPKFSGTHSEYHNFIGLFESLVHNNSSLSNVEKFNHLLSCLTDEALGTVKAFQVTHDNYPKALESLKSIYDNKCLVFINTLSKLFELPTSSNSQASTLRALTDTTSAIYDSLLSVGNETQILHGMLIHQVMNKVDKITRSKWEESLKSNELPSWESCRMFLNKRFQALTAEETSNYSQSPVKRQTPSKHFNNAHNNSKKSFITTKNSMGTECLYCNANDHFIHACTTFRNLPVEKRFEFVKGVPLCINCLRRGHTVSQCNSSKCKVCARPHHTLLHKYTTSVTTTVQAPNALPASVNVSASTNEVILATAIVQVRNQSGEFCLARALLDSGSQVNCMTQDLAQTLRLKHQNKAIDIVGIGESKSCTQYQVTTTVKSRINEFQFTSEFLVMSSISTRTPNHSISCNDLILTKDMQLADPYFFKSQKLDMLLGAESFFDLLCNGTIKTSSRLPVLQNTQFGWIVSGKFTPIPQVLSLVCHFTASSNTESEINSTLKKFWELEEIPNDKPKLTEEQLLCEKHFTTTVAREASGRYVVSLPFKQPPSVLGSSYDVAKRRYLSLERRLSKDNMLRQLYMEFMNEYLDLGHMTEIPHEIPSYSHYVIPHQCVMRPESLSTKLRVVFDASSKTSTGISLNDILMVGATVQPDLFSTLFRFRLNKFAITADITKMYRQINVSNNDRNYQLILWRKGPNQPLGMYQLNTVTYGTASAPYLATRILTHLSDLSKESYPIGSKIIQTNFYVDDLLAGADNFQELDEIRLQVNKILESAGITLAKWYSNHPSYASSDEIEFNKTENTKTLGVKWIISTDCFQFSFNCNVDQLPITKRSILSTTSRLFDPLGLLSPLIINAKIFMQELWLHNLDWDQSLPTQLCEKWESFKTQLQDINSIQIPRFVSTVANTGVQIHGFADASIRAYGCCLYVRTIVHKEVKVHLLAAKSKVAPLKTKSLPRLELCATHLLVKLWSKIKSLIHFSIEKLVFWTDSEIVLYWLKMHSSSLSTFVGNRVSDIQERSNDAIWRHVPSKENPADIVSRGCTAEELHNSIWLTGPKFLTMNDSAWPTNSHFELSKKLHSLERRKTVCVAKKHEPNPILHLFSKFSSHKKLLRIISYVLRFLRRKRIRCSPHSSPTASELQEAFLKLAQVIQAEAYAEEIACLQNLRPVSPQLQKLTPFVHSFDQNGLSFSLLRVGGRLSQAPIAPEAKFPILLPRTSVFVKAYLMHLHVSNLHAGVKILIGLSRQQIWLINARQACRQIVRNCIHCFRYKPQLLNQIMGDLPLSRVSASRPFLTVGVDFCGPFHVTLKIRGRQPVKSYLAVFVCFSTKAVHLELVPDLTSNCFLSCLKRFIARRGLPHKVLCDNATNFVGASRHLDEMKTVFRHQKDSILGFAAEAGLEFQFIPPRAPHFGGLWEAAVKSAKTLLAKTFGTIILTPDELHTAVVEVEAVLNSRPLTPLSEDPNDGEALTPAHLLIGETLRSLPLEYTPDDVNKITSLQQWRNLSALKLSFWQAWSRDYVLGLQQRTKWTTHQSNVQVGTMVVIHDDNLRPQEWLLGRVTAVIPGADGKVRVVEVRTKNGTLKRPVHKLAALPVEDGSLSRRAEC